MNAKLNRNNIKRNPNPYDLYICKKCGYIGPLRAEDKTCWACGSNNNKLYKTHEEIVKSSYK